MRHSVCKQMTSIQYLRIKKNKCSMFEEYFHFMSLRQFYQRRQTLIKRPNMLPVMTHVFRNATMVSFASFWKHHNRSVMFNLLSIYLTSVYKLVFLTIWVICKYIFQLWTLQLNVCFFKHYFKKITIMNNHLDISTFFIKNTHLNVLFDCYKTLNILLLSYL